MLHLAACRISLLKFKVNLFDCPKIMYNMKNTTMNIFQWAKNRLLLHTKKMYAATCTITIAVLSTEKNTLASSIVVSAIAPINDGPGSRL
jgi:hypothetical protein